MFADLLSYEVFERYNHTFKLLDIVLGLSLRVVIGESEILGKLVTICASLCLDWRMFVQ